MAPPDHDPFGDDEDHDLGGAHHDKEGRSSGDGSPVVVAIMVIALVSILVAIVTFCIVSLMPHTQAT